MKPNSGKDLLADQDRWMADLTPAPLLPTSSISVKRQAASLDLGLSVVGVLLATWKKGTEARFFRLRRPSAREAWTEITNLDSVFR
jgi:hypothetical protein